MSERLWLYCVTPAAHPPPSDVSGIGGAPLHAIDEGGLSVWVSTVARSEGPALRSIQSHNRVVEAALTDTVTPVPLRFGQTATEAELRAMLLADPAGWKQRLADFAGALEFGVRPLRTDRPMTAQNVRPPDAFPGRQFLTELARREREASNATAAVHDAVAGLVRMERIVTGTRGPASTSLSHLVARERVADYRHALRQLDERMPDLQLMTSGPWPPWSFAA